MGPRVRLGLAAAGKLQSYGVLLAAAVLCIYAGAWHSLRLPRATRRARRAHLAAARPPDWDTSDGADDARELARSDEDKVTAADAYLFPVIGSAALFSMYLAFQYLDPRALNALLGVYFGVLGGAGLFQALRTLSGLLVPRPPSPPAPSPPAPTPAPTPAPRSRSAASKAAQQEPESKAAAPDDGSASAPDTTQGKAKKTHTKKQKKKEEDPDLSTKEVLLHWAALARHFVLTLTALDWFVLLPLSVAVVGVYIRTRHWAASNAIAVSLAWQAVGLVELDRFTTGAVVLGGLFLYDIFWVFGTNVMVSVARNFDAPIKITWPRNLPALLLALYSSLHNSNNNIHSSNSSNSSNSMKSWTWELAMLGLGDIVIPGCFVALALRFDQARWVERLAPDSAELRRFSLRDKAFPTPYFHATLAAYLLGLVVTMTIMTVFNAAQPALLYLSPACVGALALTAASRREWSAVWSWADIDDEDDDDDEDEDEDEDDGDGDDDDKNKDKDKGDEDHEAEARGGRSEGCQGNR